MKKALLVVSSGTDDTAALEKDIGALERALVRAFPDRTFRRAFTSAYVRRALRRKRGVAVDGVVEALTALRMEGYQDVLVQPTYLENGEEMEALRGEARLYQKQFPRFAVGRPLLTTIDDYLALADAIIASLPALDDSEALVLVGLGTDRRMNPTYACLDYVFRDKGYQNLFVGALEGYPGIPEILNRLAGAWNVRRVYLMPLMMVAEPGACNDLAGKDADSWANQLRRHYFEVVPLLQGLGENRQIPALFVRHAREALQAQPGWQDL
ncbi:MAG: sirohydrochlorin cobaltochelatase [Clostridiales bacterium]|nr:sirohydrochlorin cobaltochelatase [Clostridiales bacterium]